MILTLIDSVEGKYHNIIERDLGSLSGEGIFSLADVNDNHVNDNVNDNVNNNMNNNVTTM